MRTALAVGCLAALALAAPVVRGDIVYQNLNPNWTLYWPLANGEQIGDDVTLAGTNRTITSFSVIVSDQLNTPATYTGTFTARFFKNNGPGGTPGDPLWESSLQVSDGQPGDRTLTFPVPNVVVPDTFIWSIQADTSLPPTTSTNPDRLGPVFNDNPQIGSSQDVAYDNPGDGSGWSVLSGHANGPDLWNLEAQIVALPEPAVCGALALCGAFVLARRPRRG